MRIKYCLFTALVILIIIAANPVCSYAATSVEIGFVDTEVGCTIAPEYSFTLPPDAVIQYPQTDAVIGDFGIGELLLESGETLSIELIAGPMAAEGDETETLPYTAVFEPSAVFNESQSGDIYSVTIAIAPDAFEDAVFSSYAASLLFRVRSQLTGEIVWTGTTRITAQRRQAGDDGQGDGLGDDGQGDDGLGDDGQGDGLGDDGQGDGQGDDGEGDGLGDETVPKTEDSISEEDVPEASTPQGSVSWWWIFVAVGGIALLILMILFIVRKRQRDE